MEEFTEEYIAGLFCTSTLDSVIFTVFTQVLADSLAEELALVAVAVLLTLVAEAKQTTILPGEVLSATQSLLVTDMKISEKDLRSSLIHQC